MSYAIIPPGNKIEFTPLSEINVPNVEAKSQFYVADINRVLNQELNEGETIVGLTVAQSHVFSTGKKALTLLAVTEVDIDGSWSVRKDQEGDIIAFGCPIYDEEDKLEPIP